MGNCFLPFPKDLWLPGPGLPRPKGGGRAAQRGDTFVVVGGADADDDDAERHSDVLRFDPDGDSWELMGQTLGSPDYVAAALMAPDGFVVDCS